MANSFAVWSVTQIFPNRIEILSDPVWSGFVIAGISIGIINTFVKPILKLLSLPFIVLTMGLFLFVINAVILWIIKWLFSDVLVSLGITINISGGILSYILIGLTLGIINTFLHWLFKEGKHI
jgi:putative membrane protein